MSKGGHGDMDPYKDFKLRLLDVRYPSKSKFYPRESPRLLHYTTIPVAKNILENEEVWFSHPAVMSDRSEVGFGLFHARQILNKSDILKESFPRVELTDQFFSSLNQKFEEFGFGDARRLFVACFSESDSGDIDGRLSMWRAYGGDGRGVAIEFDTSKFSATSDSALLLGAVEYSSPEEHLEEIAKRVTFVATEIKKHWSPCWEPQYLAEIIFFRFLIDAIFMKDLAFGEEREWRAVYLDRLGQNSNLKEMISYRVSDRNIDPVLKVNITKEAGGSQESLSFEAIISKIVLGPTNSSALSVDAFKSLLREAGKEALADVVTASKIPYRPK